MRYRHVDVFSPQPYGGNSLTVFPDARGLDGAQMSLITKEMRHFESIFLERGEGKRDFSARVFDLFEELDFAGHPVIGAACTLHELHGSGAVETWAIHLKARTVTVETSRTGEGHYEAVLDQGAAQFIAAPEPAVHEEIASWFSLTSEDLDPSFPMEVVSTGLRYLVLPVRTAALARARIVRNDLETELERLGAQFAHLVDAQQMECRHWNNDGLTEDVATGSGAGCAAAYLRRHGRIGDGTAEILHQGRFVGRPSEILIRAHGTGKKVHRVEVGGAVSMIGEGELNVLPGPDNA
jgi:trans-2,3-dihydro-3-hydroxyanthranilate isomerase